MVNTQYNIYFYRLSQQYKNIFILSQQYIFFKYLYHNGPL